MFFHVVETKPGKELRPDRGRCFQAVSYTFGSFPDWFRVRMLGYLPFCFVRCTNVDHTHMAILFRAVLRRFYDVDSYRIECGVTFPCGDEQWELVSNFKAIIADEKQHKEIVLQVPSVAKYAPIVIIMRLRLAIMCIIPIRT